MSASPLPDAVPCSCPSPFPDPCSFLSDLALPLPSTCFFSALEPFFASSVPSPELFDLGEPLGLGVGEPDSFGLPEAVGFAVGFGLALDFGVGLGVGVGVGV